MREVTKEEFDAQRPNFARSALMTVCMPEQVHFYDKDGKQVACISLESYYGEPEDLYYLI